MKTKYISTKILILTVVVLFGSITACKKDYFDINTDPNHPADVPVTLLLPSAEGAIAHTLGNDYQIIGGIWAQYWTQSSVANQYNQYEQYSPAANDFDYPWDIMYSDALADLKTLENKAKESGLNQYVACSKILQAYTYQILTDNFGNVPFTEALKAEEGILEPHYTTQENIYPALVQLIDEALALIDDNATASTPGTPGTADMFFNGTMLSWRKFANTLKLRIALRLSERDPGLTQNWITSLGAGPFLGPGESVQINYTSLGGNTNPLYSAEVGLNFTQNLVASATTINFYLTNNDPRINVFYIPPASTGIHSGNAQGDYNLNGVPVSEPSARTGASAQDEASALAPVILMSSYESLFLQAEASLRFGLAGSPQALYEAAITENFNYYGIGDSAVSYLAQPSVAYPGTDQLKAIITQKWAAMCGNQNNEAWTEWRRTGFPDFFTESVNSSFPGAGFPARYFYPQTEIIANGNHDPQPPTVMSHVWWDLN